MADGDQPRPMGSRRATTLRWKSSTSDAEVGTDAIRALDLNQGNFETIRLTAPSTPGTYYYWACVDAVAGESRYRQQLFAVG